MSIQISVYKPPWKYINIVLFKVFLKFRMKIERHLRQSLCFDWGFVFRANIMNRILIEQMKFSFVSSKLLPKVVRPFFR